MVKSDVNLLGKAHTGPLSTMLGPMRVCSCHLKASIFCADLPQQFIASLLKVHKTDVLALATFTMCVAI